MISDTSPPLTTALAADGRSAILDAVPAGIFETDADGLGRYVNRSFLDYTGLSAEAAAGSGWVEAIHPADRERVVAEWLAAVAAKREIAIEFRFLRPDGTTMWAAGHAGPIRAADGQVTGYIGTVTDVTAVVEERHSSEKNGDSSTRSWRSPARCSACSTATGGSCASTGPASS